MDLGIAVLAYSGWCGTYLKGDFGLVSGRKESYDVTYNGAGVGTPQKTIDNFTKNYFGLGLGFDTRDDRKGWGVFFELGARKINDQSTPVFIGGLGVNYGF